MVKNCLQNLNHRIGDLPFSISISCSSFLLSCLKFSFFNFFFNSLLFYSCLLATTSLTSHIYVCHRLRDPRPCLSFCKFFTADLMYIHVFLFSV
uniref:Uncharacterized protein n=1 Tax=Cannabis sativa TaxID=3483 RepID=A0A803RB00_CANSA